MLFSDGKEREAVHHRQQPFTDQSSGKILDAYFFEPSANPDFPCYLYPQFAPSLLYPQFEKESARLASFTSWPSELKMRPEELAKAGFYHFPVDKHPDQVVAAMESKLMII